MYLEKLEIQGFKSFANKNVLVFPGMLDNSRRGITAIVGPNGSGKSNVADAVRWVLGEQSMKILRGKKSEDIIFSGSDKKGKLGMAEVSLYLNNEDASISSVQNRKLPIDYSQVVITRRLFRNGDSEYLINNSRVRLYDIQMFLAKAKFGQKTYSVIGQGMVEGFLNISLAERKEFFDEATGVKQFQIKRDESLNKLRASYENLNQAQMLLAEIEPRLKSLTRQVNKLQKRGEIEAELKSLQLSYYSKIWHEIYNKFNKFNKQFLEIEKIKFDKEKKLKALNRELDQMEAENKINSDFNDWQKNLSNLQNQRDDITKQLARLDARLEMKLEANGQFDLSWLNSKKEELSKEIKKINEEIEILEKNISHKKEWHKKLNQDKKSLDDKINNINNELIKHSSASNNHGIKKINEKLKRALNKLEQGKDENDLNKLKRILQEIKEELRQVLKLSDEHNKEEGFEKMKNDLIELTQANEKIIIEINENNFRVSAWSERVKLLSEKKNKSIKELENIKNKLKQYEKEFDSIKITQEQKHLRDQLNKLEHKIKAGKEKINSFSRIEEEKRNRLFSLQKNLQQLQNKINSLNNQLNELKINSTRYETRLEDLEIEIRNNFGDLKEIKQNKVENHIDTEAALEKISHLKRQLELIGGIDPEIENEYINTKERFDFLSDQVNDLTKAINSLEEIIKELDLTIKEKFDREFKLISAKFEEYFKILFNGGKAKIIKIMEEIENKNNKKDLTESTESFAAKISQDDKIKFLQKHNATGLAGIEIQATPPGKKIKLVSMLSGGERALTAIALICAIISANPSPFVVLDEVDAALDEANSERLAKILDDLSQKTQFIIITHNRASMRKANVLYGITMGDDGVSKLLSIKLDEVKEK